MRTVSEEHVKVAIIGAGPAGIGAALGLNKRGVNTVCIVERRKEIGGIPALYKKKTVGLATFAQWRRGRVIFGEDYVRILSKKLDKSAVSVWTESQVLEIDPKNKALTLVNPNKGLRRVTADAIVLACGAREKTAAERGWITGARPARVLFTKHLLDFIDENECLPLKQPVIFGSDLIAYAAAAKLNAAGAKDSIILDRHRRPECSYFERLYFRRWSKSKYIGPVHTAEVVGNKAVSAIKVNKNDTILCDGVVLSGELVPNSELALQSNLEVEMPSRMLILKKDNQLSEPGWFAAGNILGGFHGAEWCYFNGLRTAKSVVNYLARGNNL